MHLDASWVDLILALEHFMDPTPPPDAPPAASSTEGVPPLSSTRSLQTGSGGGGEQSKLLTAVVSAAGGDRDLEDSAGIPAVREAEREVETTPTAATGYAASSAAEAPLSGLACTLDGAFGAAAAAASGLASGLSAAPAELTAAEASSSLSATSETGSSVPVPLLATRVDVMSEPRALIFATAGTWRQGDIMLRYTNRADGTFASFREAYNVVSKLEGTFVASTGQLLRLIKASLLEEMAVVAYGDSPAGRALNTAVEKLATQHSEMLKLQLQASATPGNTERLRADMLDDVLRPLRTYQFADGLANRDLDLNVSAMSAEVFLYLWAKDVAAAAGAARAKLVEFAEFAAEPVAADSREVVLRSVEGVASTGRSNATEWHIDALKQGTSPDYAEVKEMFAGAVGTAPSGSSGADAPEAIAAAAAAVSRLSFRTPDCVIVTAEVPRLFKLMLTDRALGPMPLIIQVAPRVFLPLVLEHRGEPVSTPVIRTLVQSAMLARRVPVLELFAKVRAIRAYPAPFDI